MRKEESDQTPNQTSESAVGTEGDFALFNQLEGKISQSSLRASGKSLFNQTIGYIASTRSQKLNSRREHHSGMVSETSKPQRISLQARRMGEYAFKSAAAANGGVTATPNTGQIPKIMHLNSANASQESPGKSGKHSKVGKRKSRLSNLRLWIPAQHGAYPMLVIPFWTGVFLSSFSYMHPVLFGFWVLSFFAFHATGTWLKSGRKERYFPPVKYYFLTTGILGIVILFFIPPLLSWGIFFLPLVGVGLWQAWLKKDTSVLARSVAVFAAGAMLLVSYDVGVNFYHPFQFWSDLSYGVSETAVVVSPFRVLSGWAWALMVTWCLVAYYWSTVFYVKALVRERKSKIFYRVQVGFHVVMLILMLGAKYLSWIGWGTTVFWIFLVFRAVFMPVWNQRKTVPFTVKQIGIQEVLVALIQLLVIFV